VPHYGWTQTLIKKFNDNHNFSPLRTILWSNPLCVYGPQQQAMGRSMTLLFFPLHMSSHFICMNVAVIILTSDKHSWFMMASQG
jgi:hypothetical protein